MNARIKIAPSITAPTPGWGTVHVHLPATGLLDEQRWYEYLSDLLWYRWISCPRGHRLLSD
jgi:hypothetical protein